MPVIRLLNGAKLMKPQKDIQITLKSRGSRFVDFSQMIMERYLNRNGYEFSSDSFVYAEWFQMKEEQEKQRDLERDIIRLLKLVREMQREKQLPCVYNQLIQQLKGTVFLYENRMGKRTQDLISICQNVFLREEQAAEYLREAETKRQLDRLEVQLAKSREKWIFTGHFASDKGKNIRLNTQIPGYLDRYTKAKQESNERFWEVLNERRPMIQFMQNLDLKEARQIQMLFPSIFSDDKDPVNVLTSMSREQWKQWKEQVIQLVFPRTEAFATDINSASEMSDSEESRQFQKEFENEREKLWEQLVQNRMPDHVRREAALQLAQELRTIVLHIEQEAVSEKKGLRTREQNMEQAKEKLALMLAVSGILDVSRKEEVAPELANILKYSGRDWERAQILLLRGQQEEVQVGEETWNLKTVYKIWKQQLDKIIGTQEDKLYTAIQMMMQEEQFSHQWELIPVESIFARTPDNEKIGRVRREFENVRGMIWGRLVQNQMSENTRRKAVSQLNQILRIIDHQINKEMPFGNREVLDEEQNLEQAKEKLALMFAVSGLLDVSWKEEAAPELADILKYSGRDWEEAQKLLLRGQKNDEEVQAGEEIWNLETVYKIWKQQLDKIIGTQEDKLYTTIHMMMQEEQLSHQWKRILVESIFAKTPDSEKTRRVQREFENVRKMIQERLVQNQIPEGTRRKSVLQLNQTLRTIDHQMKKELSFDKKEVLYEDQDLEQAKEKLALMLSVSGVLDTYQKEDGQAVSELADILRYSGKDWEEAQILLLRGENRDNKDEATGEEEGWALDTVYKNWKQKLDSIIGSKKEKLLYALHTVMREERFSHLAQEISRGESKLMSLEQRLLQSWQPQLVFSQKSALQKEYQLKKQQITEQVLKENGEIPAEMEAVLGKLPFIQLLHDSKTMREYVSHILYQVPDLENHIESLEPGEWAELEHRVFQEVNPLPEFDQQPVGEVGRDEQGQPELSDAVWERLALPEADALEFLHLLVYDSYSSDVYPYTESPKEQRHSGVYRSLEDRRSQNLEFYSVKMYGMKTDNGEEKDLFPIPDRVVAKPVPPRDIPSPAGDVQGLLLQMKEQQEIDRAEADIHTIQRLGSKAQAADEYGERLMKLTEQMEIQKKEIQELLKSSRQLTDPRQQQRLIDRMMKQLHGQLRLERLQRGSD